MKKFSSMISEISQATIYVASPSYVLNFSWRRSLIAKQDVPNPNPNNNLASIVWVIFYTLTLSYKFRYNSMMIFSWSIYECWCLKQNVIESAVMQRERFNEYNPWISFPETLTLPLDLIIAPISWSSKSIGSRLSECSE